MNYYEINKERILKYQREYYYKNIQRYKIYNHIYYMNIRKPKQQAERQEKKQAKKLIEKEKKKPSEKLPKTRQFISESLTLTFD